MPPSTRILQLPDVSQGRKNPLWMGLPQRLRGARKLAGLSQRQLAELADLDNAVLSRTEAHATSPTIATVEKLAAGLGISASWLAYGHEGGLPFRQKHERPAQPYRDPVPQPGAGIFGELHQQCGQRMRQAREQSGFSLRQVAEAAMLSYQAVLYTENGTTVPKVDTVEAIAVALDVPPAWLAYGIDGALIGKRSSTALHRHG